MPDSRIVFVSPHGPRITFNTIKAITEAQICQSPKAHGQGVSNTPNSQYPTLTGFPTARHRNTAKTAPASDFSRMNIKKRQE
jgi:hypothetical protein